MRSIFSHKIFDCFQQYFINKYSTSIYLFVSTDYLRILQVDLN